MAYRHTLSLTNIMSTCVLGYASQGDSGVPVIATMDNLVLSYNIKLKTMINCLTQTSIFVRVSSRFPLQSTVLQIRK